MKNNMPGAINQIQWRKEIKKAGEIPRFEIVVKENGKIVYRNKAYAGVLNFIQSVDKVETGKKLTDFTVEGDSQAFGFGHPIIQFFAMDQLGQKLTPALIEALKTLKLLKDESENTDQAVVEDKKAQSPVEERRTESPARANEGKIHLSERICT